MKRKSKWKVVMGLLLCMLFMSNSVLSVSAKTSKQRPTNAGERGWDCVWFGNYPQGEVTGEELTSAITGASYDANGDAVVDGVKYRRVSNAGIDEKDSEGMKYYDFFNWSTGGDANGYHYFRYTPVKWRVMSVDGDNAFLMADKVLDHSNMSLWSNSGLRKWLNGLDGYVECGFIDYAFTDEEKNAIYETHVVDEYDNGYASWTEESDQKIYIPSCKELSTEQYGFLPSYDASMTRTAYVTEYGKAIGMGSYKEDPKGTNYWTRSQSIFSDTNERILSNGKNAVGYWKYIYGVRPVLHLNLSSATWLYAGTITKDGTVNETPYYEIQELQIEKKNVNYKQRDTIDLSDLNVTVVYSDGRKKKIANYTTNITSIDMTTAGAKSLVISYEEDGKQISAAIGIQVDKVEDNVVSQSNAKVGDVIVDGGISYKVIQTERNSEAVIVQRAGKIKKNSIVIPNTIVIENQAYKVCGIGSKAFADCKKLKTVVIGKYVSVIEANAFKGCRALKKVIIKTTNLTNKNVAKSAFKGTNKRLVYKVQKQSYKMYKKFLKRKGNTSAKVKK